MSQSPNMFIKVTLLICFTALLLQCTESSNTKKLRGILDNRLSSCQRTERFKRVVSTCKGFVNNTVQVGDPSLQKCCSKVGSPDFGQDCLCLMREIGRVNPSDKKTQQVLEAVSSNKQLTSTCAALSGIDDCSAVVKAINQGNKILKTTIKDDLDMRSNCDKAALDLMNVCGPTVSKARSGSGINSKEVQTTVCCHELERFGDSGCFCKLGSSIPTSKDVANFLADIRAAGGTLADGCPSYAIKAANSCPTNPQEVVKNTTSPLLFEKCETATQEATKTCAPMIKSAMEPISKTDADTIVCCRERAHRRTCSCNRTRYEMLLDEFDKKRNAPQTKTCCKQLEEITAGMDRSCFCNITHHKTVTSRTTTVEFLNSETVVLAAEHYCGLGMFLSKHRCPEVGKADNSFLGVLRNTFTPSPYSVIKTPKKKGN